MKEEVCSCGMGYCVGRLPNQTALLKEGSQGAISQYTGAQKALHL